MAKYNSSFYNFFPNPPEVNPLHFKFGQGGPIPQEGVDAWDELFSARNEWRDKVVAGTITESDIERWEAVYEKFCDIIKRGVEDEYLDYYFG
jgi:hypothetical protein